MYLGQLKDDFSVIETKKARFLVIPETIESITGFLASFSTDLIFASKEYGHYDSNN